MSLKDAAFIPPSLLPDQARAPLSAVQIEAAVQRALVRGATPIEAAVEVAAEAAAHAAPQYVKNSSIVNDVTSRGMGRIFKMAALVGGSLAAGYAGWKIAQHVESERTVVDKPPSGKIIVQWVTELAESGRLMRQMAQTQMELLLQEWLGNQANVLALRNEWDGLATLLSSIGYVLPVMKAPLQAMASGASWQADWAAAAAERHEETVERMVEMGWDRAVAAHQLSELLKNATVAVTETHFIGLLQTLHQEGLTATMQQEILEKLAWRCQSFTELTDSMYAVETLVKSLSSFSDWTGTRLHRFIMMVIGLSPMPPDHNLGMIHLACITGRSSERERVVRQLRKEKKRMPNDVEVRHALLMNGPASWLPQDLVATVHSVWDEHKSIPSPNLIRYRHVVMQ